MPSVLITGASRGLGLEFARQYAADRWDVIATCRAPERAQGLLDLQGTYPNLRIEQLDVSDSASIAALSDKMRETAIDVLIQCAGIVSADEKPIWIDPKHKDQTFMTIDVAQWTKVLQVNAIAPLIVTRALLPSLRLGEQRKIAMISSRCGSIEQNLYPEYIAYGTSKAALNMAMRNMATALQQENMIVVSLNPGFVKTDMGGPNANLAPDTSVRDMRAVIAGLTHEQTGLFYRYSGDLMPW